MFWADKVAQELKERKLPLEWVDDMKTPSGRIHVGALRGVVVHELVYRALKDARVSAKFTYVFENHDPMDDIPSYLPKEKYEQYLGMPLFTVPSPEAGYKDYAEYYALEFQKVFNAIGCFPEIVWTKDLYTSGKMNSLIKECLDNAGEIRQIYEEMYKKELPHNWYPYQLYCPNCGKVSTTTVTDWDGEHVTYVCEIDKVKWTKGCGATGKASPFSTEDHMAGKLPWKVEWPAKWKAIGVTVEGAGKDHMSKGGSHDLASLVCEQVLHYPIPYPISYEWLLVGGRKMSSSRGVGTAATDMLELLPPELIRFLMVRSRITQQIDFDPAGDTIPNLFDEYQRAAVAYFEKGDQDLARMFELSQIAEVKRPSMVRFSTLTQWVQMPNMQETIQKEGVTEWVPFAKVWVEKFAPEKDTFAIQKEVPVSAKTLSQEQKTFLKKVGTELEKEWDPESFQKALFEWATESGVSSKDAFAALYHSLIGKSFGPKAGWFVLSLDKEFVRKRFDDVVNIEEENQINKDVTLLKNPAIFSIDTALSKAQRSISVGVALIKDVSIAKENETLEKEKQALLQSLQGLTTEQLGQYEEVQSYRRLYKEMGVDWHSRRPSPEALLRRVALNKGLYTVNTCVDAYNLIVMRHRVSVGAFDLDKLSFPTVLRFAQAGEEILLLGDETPTQYTEKEIAYFDQRGGFNMDFNYRDAQRTSVQLETKNLYINVDGVYAITPEKVEEVLKETCDIITKFCGGTIEEFGVEIAA